MKQHLLIFILIPLISFKPLSYLNQESFSMYYLLNNKSAKIAKEPGYKEIILYEDSINAIKIPFEGAEMLAKLKEEFHPFEIKKKTGQQDGPDFPYYAVQQGNEEIIIFNMDSEDTARLNSILVKSPLIKDQYGITVEDNYNTIISKRNSKLMNYTNYHQHTFLYEQHSNISYEIYGDLTLPNIIDPENLKLTEDQIRTWKVEYIIWRRPEL